MSRTKKFLIAILLLSVMGISLYVAVLLRDAGAFRQLVVHHPGSCESVAEITGAEDMEWGETPLELYVSADNRPTSPEDKTEPGALWKLDLSQQPPRATRLTENLPFEFHPHGISVFKKPDGVRVFVVNHLADEDRIEVFDSSPIPAGSPPNTARGLVHVRSIESPLLVTANDVAALSAESFLVTNDHGSRHPWRQALESYLRWGQGNLLQYDGREFQIADGALKFANGIWLSANSERLVLAEMLGKRLRLYQRAQDGTFQFENAIDLESAPDNVVMDATGDLWVGVHPQLLQLKAHSRDHSLRAPAEVLRIREAFSEKPVIETVLSDDGSLVSAVSVALPVDKSVLLGSIYDKKIIRCHLTSSGAADR